MKAFRDETESTRHQNGGTTPQRIATLDRALPIRGRDPTESNGQARSRG
jgi:hypothetical protein